MKNKKTYSELIKFNTFEERFDYLKLDGVVGAVTFGHLRYINQIFYKSKEWNSVRDKVILRDNGHDLGLEGMEYDIYGIILIHHINPITPDDILNRDEKLFDLENLISVSKATHFGIHYGNRDNLYIKETERRANDTCPWKH